MRAGFTVTFDDNSTQNVLITLPDFFKWAKWAGRPMEEITEGGLEDWIHCLWRAAVRTGLTVDDFDDWTATIVDIARVEVEAPKVGPKGRSKGPSSS